MKLPYKIGECVPVRDGYGKALIELGKENKSVIVLDADLATSTRSNWFAEKFPKRFIDVGIAEQNMVGIASGLSLAGKIPFVTTYGVFVTGRAFDQVRNTVCYSNLNVKIVGSHGGLSVGADGGTHQAIEDIALMNVLPNMKVFSPCDANEAYMVTKHASKIKGPVYIRLAREATNIIIDQVYGFQEGKANILNKGSDLVIAFHGTIGSEIMRAVKMLETDNIFAEVINMCSIKPLPIDILENKRLEDKPMLIIEEHLEAGGLGSIIATYYAKTTPRKLFYLNIVDRFGESGKPELLFDKFGFSSSKIVKKVKEILGK